MAREEQFRKAKGQLFLFDMNEEKPWRSARPVARKKRPSGSAL
jgi:hypothetical protein